MSDVFNLPFVLVFILRIFFLNINATLKKKTFCLSLYIAVMHSLQTGIILAKYKFIGYKS